MGELMEDGYPEDLTGLKFGRLEVMYKHKFPKRRLHHCRCECGNEIDLIRSRLLVQRSCGKCHYDVTVSGDSRTALYSRYCSMLDRCYDPKNPYYDRYGGRGIKVCDRWRECYGNFKEDMYESFMDHAQIHGEHDTTLDRDDFDGDYCPENCRWLTNAEQQRNRANNVRVTIGGVTKVLAEWIELGDINGSTVRNRIHKGMEPEQALKTPAKIVHKLYYHNIPLKNYCKERGLSYKLITTRIYQGWDIDSAVEAPKGVKYLDWLNRDSDKSLKVRSIIYYKGVPLKQYCRENDISYPNILYRVHVGWDIEDAINAPKGTQYKTWLKMRENNKNSLDNSE